MLLIIYPKLFFKMKTSKYNELYDQAYNKSLIKGTEYAKTTIIEHKIKRKYVNKVLNGVLNDLYKYKEKLYINDKKFSNIINFYNKRGQHYEFEYRHLIIPNEIADAFEKIKNIKKGYGFNQLLIELADYMAHQELGRVFQNNYSIYAFMYRLNDFNRFHINSYKNQRVEDTQLYEELRLRLYPEQDEQNSDLPPKEEKLSQNNFHLKERYSESLINLYSSITEEGIINPNKTKITDFINVFTKDFQSHNSKIYFDCESKLAALFLDELRKRKFFSNLTQTNMADSKMFISLENEISFTQTSFATNIRNANAKDRIIVSELIQIILTPKLI